MKRNDYYQERWLKPPRLTKEGLNLTIIRVFNETVGRKQEDKPVLSFAELDEDLILNKSQWNALWDLLGGENVTEWIGRRIKLLPVKIQTENGAKEVETIAIDAADPLEKENPELTAEASLNDQEPAPSPKIPGALKEVLARKPQGEEENYQEIPF